MNFATLPGVLGASQINLSGLVAETTAREQPGLIVTGIDNWWGTGEFIYAKANGSIRTMGLCVLTPAFSSSLNSWEFLATEVPNTANLGRMLCVSQLALSSGQYSWFMISGLTPINGSASVAADTAFGIAAAGQIGAIANGKQVLNARVAVAATATVAKSNCTADSGSTTLNVANTDGWFPGIYLSGTGIAALTIVNSIAPGGRAVTLSVATTAAVSGTVTGTYNNATIYYNIAHLNRPFAQGQVT